jgi:hypothetical protein
MSISMWMVSMFILGTVGMGLCLWFLKGCEKI